MKYTYYACSNPKLENLVINYFTISTQSKQQEKRFIFPTGNHYLLFHLKGKVKYYSNRNSIQFENKCGLAHVHNSYFSANTSTNFCVFGVAMKPFGIYRLFGRKFKRGSFFLSDSEEFLKNNELNELCLDLQKVGNHYERISSLEKYLIPKLRKYKEDDLVERFLKIMGDFSQEFSTKEISSKLCTNQRTLEQHFLAISGITPGKYIKLRRFDKLIKDLHLQGSSINDLILKYNYTDYSHLSRDFKKHTGLSLKDKDMMLDSFYSTFLKTKRNI